MNAFSLLDKLSNEFNGQIPNLIFFGIGIFIGVILFLITFLIVYIISKSKVKIEHEVDEIIVNDNYKIIIEAKKEAFATIYKKSSMKEKLKGILLLTLQMLEEISTLYYPESEDPMFEVSIERLVDFIEYFINRLNLIVDEYLVEKLRLIELLAKVDIKNTKISRVLEILNKKNIEELPENSNMFSKIKEKITKGIKKVGMAFTGNVINYTFYNLIDDFGSDINKLYSNQNLIFTDVSKKQEKRKIRMSKRQNKRKVGDDYA